MMTALPSPGWHLDPDDHTRLRWWDGRQWTDHLTDRADSSDQPQPGEVDPDRIARTTDAVIGHAFEDLGTLSFDDVWSAIYSLWVLGAMTAIVIFVTYLLTQSGPLTAIAAMATPALLLWSQHHKRHR